MEHTIIEMRSVTAASSKFLTFTLIDPSRNPKQMHTSTDLDVGSDKYSVILPTYNERKNLPILTWLLAKTFETACVRSKSVTNVVWKLIEVIVVCNGR